MKFKYNGDDNCFCMELVAYKIKGPHGDYLFKGDVIEVDDKYDRVIKALKESAIFKEVTAPIKTDKKNKKEVKKVND